ncbi:MAG TPA: hypothetical protein VFW53_05825 [Gallionella sp.]|nr:hypothetical protein [Gallionella sp.]
MFVAKMLDKFGERHRFRLLGSGAEEQHALFVGLDEQHGYGRLGGRRRILPI